MSNKQGTNEALTQLRKSTFFPMLPPAEQFDLMTLFESLTGEQEQLCTEEIRKVDKKFLEAEQRRKKDILALYDELLELLARFDRKKLKIQEEAEKADSQKALSDLSREIDNL